MQARLILVDLSYLAKSPVKDAAAKPQALLVPRPGPQMQPSPVLQAVRYVFCYSSMFYPPDNPYITLMFTITK